MKTKAFAFLLVSISHLSLPERVLANETKSIAQAVNRAASDSLNIFQSGGVVGLVDAVSDCWKEPSEFCLYLDFASHRLAVGTTYQGRILNEYFFAESVSQRGHVWLAPNRRGQIANDQFLYAVDQVMGRLLITYREKMSDENP